MMERLARACMARRGAVAVVVLLLFVGSLFALTRARLDSDLVSLFVSDQAEADAYKSWRARFDAAEPVLLAIPHAAPLSDDALQGLARLEPLLRAISGVTSTLSLATAPRVADDAGALRVSTWGEALAHARGDERVRLERALLVDPDVAGIFLSRDRDALLVVVRMAEDFQARPPSEQLLLEHQLVAAVAAAGLAPAKEVRAVGFPIVVSTVLEISIAHLTTLAPAAILILVLVVFFLYRRLWPMVFAVTIAFLSVVFAGAAAVLYDPRVTPLHSIAPVLIIVISLADTIFVLNAFVRAREQGYEGRDAIAQALSEVGGACVLTSVSTFCSFASFVLVPAAAMQLLGLTAGIGVASALILVVTLGPVLLDVMPTPRVRTGRRTRAAVRGLVHTTRRLAEGHPRLVVGTALVALLASAFAVTTLEVETDWARRMRPSHRLPQAEAWIKDRFGGFSTIEVVWKTTEDPLAPDLLQAQAAFAHQALLRDDVVQEISAATSLERFKDALAGTHNAGPPATAEEVAQLRLLAELGGDDPLAVFLSDDQRSSRTILRVTPTGLRAIAALAAELDGLAHAAAPAGVHIDVTGLSVMLGSWLDHMLRAQVRGLGLMAFLTVVVLTIGLRSFRAGAFALLPNSLPVLLFLAQLARPGAHFDSDYLLVCVVGLGIAVDDTIHFLTRFRAACRAGASEDAALEEAYLSAGPAMVETTFILVIGLSPLLLSDYLSARMFFTELSKVLLAALLADLLLLPAMIRLGWIRFSPRPPSSSPAAQG